jgi:hypothetical protein
MYRYRTLSCLLSCRSDTGKPHGFRSLHGDITSKGAALLGVETGNVLAGLGNWVAASG